tara:strand:- start:4680 stop:7514 length:2835 start_codon:yes stop_codon:yes gene_type:complete
MSGYLRNKEELIIQEIKNANCLKTTLGKDHTIFSIVDKKISFVVPNNDSQNIALKEFCYQSNLCSEVEAYDKGLKAFKENLLDLHLKDYDVKDLAENFYVIVKIVTNPYIRTIQNFFHQKSHNLTFREYVKSFTDMEIQNILSKEDISLGINQYFIDEEYLISGTLQIPNKQTLSIPNEDEEIKIDITPHIEKRNSNSNLEFLADIPLNKLRSYEENIDLFKTELFYDKHIKKIIFDKYILDFEKYNFSQNISLLQAENTTEYDEDYIQQIKEEFGNDAEYVLKEEQKNEKKVNNIKRNKEIINGEINTCEEQMKFIQSVQNSNKFQKSKLNEELSDNNEKQRQLSEKIKNINSNEKKMWENCEVLIQKRLKEEKLFQETNKEFEETQLKYTQLCNLEKTCDEKINDIKKEIQIINQNEKTVENNIENLKKTIERTENDKQEDTEELNEILDQIVKIQESCNQRIEILKNVDDNFDKEVSKLSKFEEEEEILKIEEETLINTWNKIKKRIEETQNKIKETTASVSNMKKILKSEKPLLNKDGKLLDQMFLKKKEKEIEIEESNYTLENVSKQLTNFLVENKKLKSEKKELIEIKEKEMLNKRQKSAAKIMFQTEYDLKKDIYKDHKKKFEGKMNNEETALKQTKEASIEKIECEKMIENLENYKYKLQEKINKILKTLNKCELDYIEKKKKISVLQNNITNNNGEIENILQENKNITKKVQFYRQQLLKQVHIHTNKDRHITKSSSNVTNLLISLIKERNIDTILDIGARTGEFSKLFSRNSQIKNIHIFEPNFGLYNTLLETSKKLGFSNWNIHNIAIMSNTINKLPYYYSGLENSVGSFDKSKIIGNQNSIQTKYIPTKPLDNINIDDGNMLVKIDCGNKNFQVIQSMAKLLESKKINVLCIIAKDRLDPNNDFLVNFLKMYFKRYRSVMMPRYSMVFEEHK